MINLGSTQNSAKELALQAVELLEFIPRAFASSETAEPQVLLLSAKVRLPKGSSAEQVVQEIKTLRPCLEVHSKGLEHRFPTIALGYPAKVDSSCSNEELDYEEITHQCIELLTFAPRAFREKSARLMSIKVQLPKGCDAKQVVQKIKTLRNDLKAHTKESENEHPWLALGYKM